MELTQRQSLPARSHEKAQEHRCLIRSYWDSQLSLGTTKSARQFAAQLNECLQDLATTPMSSIQVRRRLLTDLLFVRGTCSNKDELLARICHVSYKAGLYQQPQTLADIPALIVDLYVQCGSGELHSRVDVENEVVVAHCLGLIEPLIELIPPKLDKICDAIRVVDSSDVCKIPAYMLSQSLQRRLDYARPLIQREVVASWLGFVNVLYNYQVLVHFDLGISSEYLLSTYISLKNAYGEKLVQERSLCTDIKSAAQKCNHNESRLNVFDSSLARIIQLVDEDSAATDKGK